MRKLWGCFLALTMVLGMVMVSTTPAQAEDYRCVYVAKTKKGLGHRIPGTRGVDEVHYRKHAPKRIKIKKRLRACQRAASKCRAKLAIRKLKGKNPRARCVVLRITRG